MQTVMEISHTMCSGCSACVNLCPTSAIKMKKDIEGFYYPVIDNSECIGCESCYKNCPINKPDVLSSTIECIGCYAKNYDIREHSSSGGIFYLLASEIIRNGGVVYGASFNDSGFVKHVKVDQINDLFRLQGSKYLQSHIGKCYQSVKFELSKNRQVLFSGTPCQIAGLKAYLAKEYEKLICVEVICHGVPSEEAYLKFLTDHFQDKDAKCLSFRDKTWNRNEPYMKFVLSNGTVVYEPYAENVYMKGFIYNCFTRWSCFNCKYKHIHSLADITVGDFWSASEFHPEMDIQKGISAVIIRTKKGQKIFEEIKPDLYWTHAKVEEVLVWNESLVQSAKYSKCREQFFLNWESIPFDQLVTTVMENDHAQNRGGKNRSKNIWLKFNGLYSKINNLYFKDKKR